MNSVTYPKPMTTLPWHPNSITDFPRLSEALTVMENYHPIKTTQDNVISQMQCIQRLISMSSFNNVEKNITTRTKLFDHLLNLLKANDHILIECPTIYDNLNMQMTHLFSYPPVDKLMEKHSWFLNFGSELPPKKRIYCRQFNTSH